MAANTVDADPVSLISTKVTLSTLGSGIPTGRVVAEFGGGGSVVSCLARLCHSKDD